MDWMDGIHMEGWKPLDADWMVGIHGRNAWMTGWKYRQFAPTLGNEPRRGSFKRMGAIGRRGATDSRITERSCRTLCNQKRT